MRIAEDCVPGFDGGQRGGNRLKIISGQGLAGQFSRPMRKVTLADSALSDFHVRSLLHRTSDLSNQFIWTHVLRKERARTGNQHSALDLPYAMN